MPARQLAKLFALLLAAMTLTGGILLFTLPSFINDWNSAQHTPAASTHTAARQTTGTPSRALLPGPVAHSQRAKQGPSWLLLGVLWFAGWTVVGNATLGVLALKLVRGRVRNRDRRDYQLYEVHLSMHDEAKPQDLEEMVEAIANAIREFPEDRARNGQPFIAFELHYGPGEHGDLEWSIAVRCESRVASAIDGIVASAYPDVRVGHRHGEDPQPINGTLCAPGYVLRYRKARSFVYALSSDGDEREGSPPLEAIAAAQVALGKPSSVRFQLIPAPVMIEEFARKRFHRHENALARSESWGMREAGLRSSLSRQEMMAAKRTQNRSMLWLEVQVAAETRADANRIGASVQASRGDNRLHRRWMMLSRRIELYRRRFPTAYPPLWPTPSLRTLVSSVEVAHLLELPSARMKGVPVRRLTLPRLPAPPDVERATAAFDIAPPAAGIAASATAAIDLPPSD
jgi:hypothetical protein